MSERFNNALYQLEMKIEKANDKEESEYNKGYYDGLVEAYEIARKWKSNEE